MRDFVIAFIHLLVTVVRLGPEAYDRAKQHVSSPAAVAVMKANIGLREENLTTTLHISDERIKNYVEILRRSLRWACLNSRLPLSPPHIRDGVRQGRLLPWFGNPRVIRASGTLRTAIDSWLAEVSLDRGLREVALDWNRRLRAKAIAERR